MAEVNIALVEKIYTRIESDQHSFSSKFYSRLFELSPAVEKLFKSVGMEMQGKMVIQAIGIGIKSYDNDKDFNDWDETHAYQFQVFVTEGCSSDCNAIVCAGRGT